MSIFSKDKRLAKKDGKIADLRNRLIQMTALSEGRREHAIRAESETRRIQSESEKEIRRLQIQLESRELGYRILRGQNKALRRQVAGLPAPPPRKLLSDAQTMRIREQADQAIAEKDRQLAEANKTIGKLIAELSRRADQSARYRSVEQKLEETAEELRREREKRLRLEVDAVLNLNQIADLEQLLRDAETPTTELLPKLVRLREKIRRLRNEKEMLIQMIADLGGDSVLIDTFM